MLKGGMHCSDIYGPNWDVNEDARRVRDEEVEQMRVWVGEFYAMKGKEWKGGAGW